MTGSYFLGLAIAVVVVALTLGLISLDQTGSPPAPPAGSPVAVANQDGEIGQGGGTQDGGQKLDELTQQGLLQIAHDKLSPRRIEAILKLLEKQEDLSSLVPGLAQLTMDRDQLVQVSASIVLNRIGPTGAPFLRPLIESADPKDISLGCTALKEMGGAAEFSTQIRDWLESSDSNIRKRSLFALQGSPQLALEMMDLVIATLDDPDFNVQCMACRVLGNLGPDAIDAADRVFQLYREGNPSARSWAAYVLGSIGPTANLNTAEILVGSLESFPYFERQRTLQGIAKMGSEASEIADNVREIMNNPDKRVKPDAAYALWRITGDATESLEAMKQALGDINYVFDAIELVGKMEEAALPLVPNLVELLEQPDQEFGELIVIALGNIGPGAEAGIPAIEKVIANPLNDALYRFHAREALAKIKK